MHFLKEGKNKQIMFLILIGVGIFVAIIIFSFYSVKSTDSFYSGGIKIKPVSSSFDNERSFKVIVQDKVRVLESENSKLSKELERRQKENDQLKEKIEEINSTINSIEQNLKNDRLKVIKESIPDQPPVTKPDNYSYQKSDYGQFVNQEFIKGGAISGNQDNTVQIKPIQSGIESKVFYIANEKKEFDPEVYLPVGAYAEAKLLSSVDVGVGVSSQSQPRPCEIRVTSKAWSASQKENLNRKYKTDIRGGVITCEASGDLSSERGYIRLLEMSLEGSKGRIVEFPVHGFVSSYGKAGIRGRIIERETDKVWWATLTGFFSSIGSGVQQRYQPNTTITGSIAQTQQNSDDILRSGLGGGASKALDRVSEYYVDKMKQIQPVVSLPQGLDIEIHFTQGTFIDGRKNPDSVKSEKPKTTNSTNF